ncbi:MAG: exopolysaccharide biosynthesis protein [Rhodobacteraceae bacterium]|nr:exopolysaccharide biosynthesis protein [Paracoccaceae bacterium]
MVQEAKQDGTRDGADLVNRPSVPCAPMTAPRKFTRKRKANKAETPAADANRPTTPGTGRRDQQEASQRAHAEKLKRDSEAQMRRDATLRAQSQKASAVRIRATIEKQSEAHQRTAEKRAARDGETVQSLPRTEAALRKAMTRQDAQDLAEVARLQAEQDAARRRSAQRTRAAAEKARHALHLMDQAPAEDPKSQPRSGPRVSDGDHDRGTTAPSRFNGTAKPNMTEPLVLSDPEPGTPSRHARWDRLRAFPVDEKLLRRNRIITADRSDPAHAAFDILRTRLLQALRERGWHRVAITSPTKNCGKTFTAANLAISLSRQENCRTILMDLDLRNPSLHKVLGAANPGAIGDMLRGKITPRDHLRRMAKNQIHAGHNVAFGFNDEVEPYAAELLQETSTSEALREMEARFDPDVVLFDLPPALYHDDVMGFRPQFDGVLLVIGGGVTSPKEVKAVERRLSADTPLLGTVLNYAEGTNVKKYSY